MVQVITRKRADTVRRKKLRFVEHARQHTLQLLATYQRQQPPHPARRSLRHFDMLGNVWVIVDEPLHATLEPREPINDFRLQRFYREERNQANHGANFQEVLFAIRQMQHIVIEAILLVPQRNSLRSEIVHSPRDIHEVLDKFTGYVFVGWIVLGQLQRDSQHVQAIHAHPTGTIGLLEMSTGWQWG